MLVVLLLLLQTVAQSVDQGFESVAPGYGFECAGQGACTNMPHAQLHACRSHCKIFSWAALSKVDA